MSLPITSEPSRHPKLWTAGTLVYTSTGLGVLFLWLLWGDFAWGLRERAITPVAQLMLRGFESPDWLVGLFVGSLPSAIGFFLGPAVSVWSDRHRGRWGRRIPFLLFSTPVVSLSMLGLAFTPAVGAGLHGALGASSPGLMGCRLMVFGFFWTSFEVATITVNNLFGALINDVVPPAVIGRFYSYFRMVSLVAGIIFNYQLMGKAGSHALAIFVGLALFNGVGFTLMCLFVKEGEHPPPEPRAAVNFRGRMWVPIVTYLRECFTNPFYLWFFLATTFGGFSLAPVNTFSVFHGRSVGMSDDLYGKCLALSFAVSLLIAYPLGALADRFHPLRLGIVTMSLYAVSTIWAFRFANNANTFFIAFVLHTVIAGTYLTSTASVAQRVLPKAKFAQFNSAGGIFGAICFGVLPPVLGIFIQRLNHEYRYAFLLGSVIALMSAFSYFRVLVRFQRLGGEKGYVAP